jgi:hypothetical protein
LVEKFKPCSRNLSSGPSVSCTSCNNKERAASLREAAVVILFIRFAGNPEHMIRTTGIYMLVEWEYRLGKTFARGMESNQASSQKKVF